MKPSLLISAFVKEKPVLQLRGQDGTRTFERTATQADQIIIGNMRGFRQGTDVI
jgi:hypothetical protein